MERYTRELWAAFDRIDGRIRHWPARWTIAYLGVLCSAALVISAAGIVGERGRTPTRVDCIDVHAAAGDGAPADRCVPRVP